MNSFLPRCLASLCLLAASAVLRADEPAIIAKARAFLGSEAALAGVRSLRYEGTLTTVDPTDPKANVTATMDILFQKPEQQRIVATSENSIETTALDGYEGWQRVEDKADPAKRRQFILSADQVKRLRANTWENLGFFRGIEKLGGRIEVQGEKTVDGVACQKLAFIYAANIVFYRYFDVATGRLVLTETESGGSIREEGEQSVAGIRFPRTLITSSKAANGQMQTVKIEFGHITVNEDFPAKTFTVPMLLPR